VTEQGPVRIPKDVLDELKAVRRYTRAEVLEPVPSTETPPEPEKGAQRPWWRFWGG
jgi:hypothetical protein